jgi:hypothetical protein
MAWDTKYVKYALAKAEKQSVKVFKDQYNSVTISVGESVSMALWAGDELNVFLINGKVRRYKDQYNYRVV